MRWLLVINTSEKAQQNILCCLVLGTYLLPVRLGLGTSIQEPLGSVALSEAFRSVGVGALLLLSDLPPAAKQAYEVRAGFERRG